MLPKAEAYVHGSFVDSLLDGKDQINEMNAERVRVTFRSQKMAGIAAAINLAAAMTIFVNAGLTTAERITIEPIEIEPGFFEFTIKRLEN